MHFNLVNWLFQDPCQATGCYDGGPAPEMFHFYPHWIIFCVLGLVVAFYYSVEGRKRFAKNRPWVKYMLDRYLGWLAIICIIALPLIGARAALYQYFFAWRVWRYLWLVGLLVWAILFLVHRFRVYPQERDYYLHLKKREQYIPKGNRRKAATSR
jgi:small-conductance mechanosensitive channel